jgi:hypothetical protein
MQKVEMLISTPKKEYHFKFIAHVSQTPAELQIEDRFYMDSSSDHRLPEGKHYEFEILNDWRDFATIARVHWHVSRKTNQMYVCYTRQVSSEHEAASILSIWGCGVVYANLKLQDFAPGGELPPSFLEMLANEHGIHPLGVRFLEEGEEFSE